MVKEGEGKDQAVGFLLVNGHGCATAWSLLSILLQPVAFGMDVMPQGVEKENVNGILVPG